MLAEIASALHEADLSGQAVSSLQESRQSIASAPAWNPAWAAEHQPEPGLCLPSVYKSSELACSTITAAAMELHRLLTIAGMETAEPVVSQRLASLWFGNSLLPIGWEAPPAWAAISGDYRCADGWIRIHANYDHHRAAALSVLAAKEDRAAVSEAIASWRVDELEKAIVEAGGCAAAMRSSDSWRSHQQGRAIASEPLVHWSREKVDAELVDERFNLFKSGLKHPGKPLHKLRVLDLTRVLAGPTATRFLSAYGADVLRVDPEHWNESHPTLEMSVGKTRSHLDLKSDSGKATFTALLKDADVLVHGYRPGALAALGFGVDKLRQLNPALVEVSLCAYGWSGPWAGRRGFDSLVQMSCGIADHGAKITGKDHPVSLPVQALDHATGYLLAASVLRGLSLLYQQHHAPSARLSLARTAMLLISEPLESMHGTLGAATDDDYQQNVEETDWGPVKRLQFPISLRGCDPGWNIKAGELRVHPPEWRDRQ